MLLLGLFIVVVVVVFACLILARIAPGLNLVASPGEHRQHSHDTPLVGGIAIYLGLLTGLVLIDASFANMMPALLLMCILGVLDDRYALPSWVRFLVQIGAAGLMVELTGIRLETLGYVFSHSNELYLNSWSLPLTIFAVVGVINAINMSDGMDGLACSLVLITLIGMALLGHPSTGLTIVAAASVFAVLILNGRFFKTHAKVFLGDAGSMMLAGLQLCSFPSGHTVLAFVYNIH